MNEIKFTYDKRETVESEFSIFDIFIQVLFNVFSSLDKHHKSRGGTFYTCLSESSFLFSLPY